MPLGDAGPAPKGQDNLTGEKEEEGRFRYKYLIINHL